MTSFGVTARLAEQGAVHRVRASTASARLASARLRGEDRQDAMLAALLRRLGLVRKAYGARHPLEDGPRLTRPQRRGRRANPKRRPEPTAADRLQQRDHAVQEAKKRVDNLQASVTRTFGTYVTVAVAAFSLFVAWALQAWPDDFASRAYVVAMGMAFASLYAASCRLG